MRSLQIDRPDPIDAASAISDVRLAAALLAGAASKAEEELARTTGPTRATLAAAGPLQKIIRGCNEMERALAGRPAVNTAHPPSPATLRTIAAVEAVRSSMPSAATRETIATVEAATRAVSRSFKG